MDNPLDFYLFILYNISMVIISNNKTMNSKKEQFIEKVGDETGIDFTTEDIILTESTEADLVKSFGKFEKSMYDEELKMSENESIQTQKGEQRGQIFFQENEGELNFIIFSGTGVLLKK